MIQIVEDLSQRVPVRRACQAMGLSHHTLYRRRRIGQVRARVKGTPGDRRALNSEEKAQVRSTLNSERFADQAPREIYATLLDEGTYLCSVSSRYRILRENQEVCERRNQLRHPSFAKPELLATGPNQVWTWDITKLLGPVTWTYFYLYGLLDLFSRFVVGWLIAPRESTELAEVLIAETCTQQNIPPQQLTLHADRGAAMLAKPLVALLADLGVSESHSRPHVANDNPLILDASAVCRMPAVGRRFSFPGTTLHTIIPGSV